jgi:hypothetical protein
MNYSIKEIIYIFFIKAIIITSMIVICHTLWYRNITLYTLSVHGLLKTHRRTQMEKMCCHSRSQSVQFCPAPLWLDIRNTFNLIGWEKYCAFSGHLISLFIPIIWVNTDAFILRRWVLHIILLYCILLGFSFKYITFSSSP